MNSILKSRWRSHFLKTYSAEFEGEFSDLCTVSSELGAYAGSIGARQASTYLRGIASMMDRCADISRTLQGAECEEAREASQIIRDKSWQRRDQTGWEPECSRRHPPDAEQEISHYLIAADTCRHGEE